MHPPVLAATDALVVVDPQNDFLPGGSLAVADGNRIFDPINALMPRFRKVYATRDWHPRDHRFFTEFGGPWPLHCLADTPGAAFSPRLAANAIDVVISKGTDPQTDGYSGFAATNLAHHLREQGVTRVFVCGLATDYCVKATALDAKLLGFDVIVVTDAIAAVNVKPSDETDALAEIRAAGIQLCPSIEITGDSRAAV